MISAVVLTKNSEEELSRCLESIAWCDEVIVVDDYSADDTLQIAKKFKTKIFKRKLENDFSEQRNFGLSKAKGEWVLFIDSDEVIPQSLQKEIIQSVKDTDAKNIAGFYLKRNDFQFGRWLKHGETANVQLLRLARKNSGIWKRAVHEVWEIDGETKTLQNPIHHYPHKTLTEFLKELEVYSTINAQVFFKQRRKTSFFQIIAFPAGKFIQNFIFRLGFLDGTIGFIVAMLMSFHSFLTRAKLYFLWNNDKR